MPQLLKVGNDQRALRLPHVIDLLRMQPLPVEELLPRLNPRLRAAGLDEIKKRALQLDLEWLIEQLGAGGIERVARTQLVPAPPPEFNEYRIFYRLAGAEDLIPITGSLIFLSEMEALALVTARAQLSTPSLPGVTEPTAGPLADALDSLIRRLGFAPRDSRIPDILAVTQGTPQPYEPAHVLVILRAIRLGEAVTMGYHPLKKAAHQVVAQPVRLVLVDGEPYVWAWEGASQKLKNYKVARIKAVTLRARLTGVPSGLDNEVRANLASGFRGVAGPGQRGRVVVRLTADGVPHLRDRRLGGKQTWEDLPDGGARVAFNTAGMDALQHFLLQCGPELVVESPASLVEWFRVTTEAMAARYRLPS